MTCYCGSERPYEECCSPFLHGEAKPDTAEALMRARYTAYAVQNIDYVAATNDPDTADPMDRESAAKWSRDSEWDGLDIVATAKGGPDDDEGEVEFIAHYTINGQGMEHHERATFRRIDGDWFYMDGTMIKPKPARRESPKIGRNEPCPCGSGKKYKKCHGR